MNANRTIGTIALAAATAACGSGGVALDPVADDGIVESDTLDASDAIDEPADASERAERLRGTAGLSCEERAGLFAAGPSVNPDLADPESSATCDGDVIVVTANGVPDYTYIETSPGSPRAADLEFEIPAEPEVAADTTDIPALGSAAVSLTGIPIYGPTEGTGGDVLSLGGALSDCGSHNGPTGFHIHLFGTSDTTDCLFTPAQAAAAPQLLGFAFDGYPIYTGNDQYTSSWELTDESLFATDTWGAHSYVEGSGDLDECNGLVDENGDYAYYTTDTFPYVLGCYTGVVELDDAGGGGGGGGGGRPPQG